MPSTDRKKISLNPFEGSWRYLKIFRRHIGRRLYVIFVLALFAAMSEGFGIALLLPLLAAADVGASSGIETPEILTVVLEMMGVSTSLLGILLLIGAAFLMKGAITFGYQAYGGYLQAQLMRELKAKMFSDCSQMNYAYYVSRNTGHFVNVINSQISAFYNSFAAYKGFVVNGVKTLTYLAMAMLLAWRFGLMAIAAAVFLLVSFRILNQYVRNLSRKASNELGILNKLLVQAIQSFKYLASTARMGHFSVGVDHSVQRATGYQVRQQIWQAFSNSVSEPLSVLLIIAIIVAQVVIFEQDLAPILVAILLFHRGMTAVMTVQTQWQTAMNSIGAVEMVESEFRLLAEHRELNGMTHLASLSQGIQFDQVRFAYKPETANILEDISLKIPAFTTVAFVGESGAGKSTMVDLITLMLKPLSGRILIDGIPGEDVELQSWRSQIGYVSQETVVFDDTIAANIALSDGKAEYDTECLESIRNAASQAQLSSFIEALPEGYMTRVGDRGIRLSGGQRQRLFIARELYRQPKLLILDEATSSLDSESERGVQSSIDALHGKMTVIIIAHRLATIKNVDRVFVFSQGKLVEEGDYMSLRDGPDTKFGAMVDLQTL